MAPLYFRGEIEFGVINQSSSAFSHILGDVSLVVYQIERLASFSAVTDRLAGERGTRGVYIIHPRIFHNSRMDDVLLLLFFNSLARPTV